MRAFVFLALGVSALCPQSASAGSYFFRDFRIAGATSVDVSGINDQGDAVGIYKSSPPTPYGIPFVGKPDHVQALPLMKDYSLIHTVTGINNAGTIVGTYQGNFGYQAFVLVGGAYKDIGPQIASAAYPFVPFIGTGNRISLDLADGGASPSIGLGTPSRIVVLGGPNGAMRWDDVASINYSFQIAGQIQTLPGNAASQSLFIGDCTTTNGCSFQPFQPPAAIASYGGWINDAGQVAGSYRDASGALHGFVYAAGNFTYFDMPTAPVTLSVQGIDGMGRVVGAYADHKAAHGFVFSSNAVTLLGAFPASDQIKVSISHFGHNIAISDSSISGSRSWLAYCARGGKC